MNNEKPTFHLIPYAEYKRFNRKRRLDILGSVITWLFIIALVALYFNGAFDGIIREIKENLFSWIIKGVVGIFILGFLWSYRAIILTLGAIWLIIWLNT